MASRGIPATGILHNGASVQLWNMIELMRSERDNNKRSKLAQGAFQLVLDLDRVARASVVLLAESSGQAKLIQDLTDLCNEQSDVLQGIAEGRVVVARDVLGEDKALSIDHLKVE